MSSSIFGLDVSHWEPGINFKKANSKYAIMKLTEKTNYTDPTCKTYVDQCLKNNIPFGVYHFARGGSIAEADFFIKKAKPYIGKGILILDWEDQKTLHNVAQAKKWLDYVRKETGVIPWIYMSRATANNYNWSAVAKTYPLWVARYNSTLGSIKHWTHPIMWQYTESHKVQGHTVDANHYYGTMADWKYYSSKH